MVRRFVLISSILLSAVLSASKMPDFPIAAEAPNKLQAVTVVADRGVVVSSTDSIKVKQSLSITELLLESPSAYVGDYGGYSALKSVSLRGMGSPHTAIYIDGVRVGNVQSGQCDIGSIGLWNFSSAVIDYAQNSLSFNTERPTFTSGRKVSGRFGVSGGSFGTLLPVARMDWKLSEKVALSVNADAVFSKGDFSYGNGLVRQNNDIRQLRGGLDLFGTLSGGDWHAKAWMNSSERGTPGSTSWPSTDRQQDRNIFAQGLLRTQVTTLYSIVASAKAAYDNIHYTSSFGDSRYGQTELQLNSSHKFSVNRYLVLSFAADVVLDKLESTGYSQSRWGTVETFSAAIRAGRFKADVALQYEGAFDSEASGRNFLSPSIDLGFNVVEGLNINAFARRACRIPTFNELYYVGYGNPDLEPEDAWLTDIGAVWKRREGCWSIKASIDGYWNMLSNKITSAPSAADPNIWLPYNIGRVRSAGADASAGFDFTQDRWQACFSAKYSFQDAVDKTPGSSTENQQIAYIARHSLSLNASATFKGWGADAAWNLRAGRRDSYGEMPDWNTLDLYLKKAFKLGKGGIPAIKIALKNITSSRFELVSGYPMPGFSITGGVEYNF